MLFRIDADEKQDVLKSLSCGPGFAE
ncbi:uncharacterized protein METZ01_LOCUS14588 [marine metagenome]|uniref:Uncharacterized protein n=1 Tax=marine metagenome TaxID=408172 RepID=A0A381P5A1_9ZZZZ